MKYIISFLFLFGCLSTVSAQVAKDTRLMGDTTLQDVQTMDIYSDSLSNSMIIFAPSGFNKQRIGAPTREQIMVLQGEAQFIFEEKTIAAKTGTYLVIPANTRHRVVVAGEAPIKMLVIQDAL
ncbi:MAG: cupin domain-containing protein [Bacteroidota bacterium]